MDKTGIYIKMADCPEIQGHTPDIGDFYWERHIDGVETIWIVYDTGFNDYERLDWGTVWLPRQDQLQEMIDWSGVSYLVSTQAHIINEFYNHISFVPDSMEQLWLAFVMKEKYGKVWSGNKWK